MSNLRIAAMGAFGLAVLAGVLWLAGALFYLMNKANPLGVVNMLTWWEYFRAYGGDEGISKQLVSCLLIALAMIILPLVALIVQSRRTRLHGESRFASHREIGAAGLMKSTGIIVGKLGRVFLMFGSLQFVSLTAPTRSGKGTGIVIPNLLNYDESVVVLDVKLENFLITSKFRAENGQSVYLINPFSLETHRQNALGYLSDDEHVRVTEVLSIGHMLYPRVGGGRETMWSDTARDLFVGLVLYLCETPELPRTIGEVLRQSSGKGQPLAKHLQDIIHARNYDAIEEPDGKGGKTTRYVPKASYNGTGEPQLSEKCVDALNRFIVAPGNTAGGILTTFTAPLTLWASPVVDAATSANDFDLRDLRKRRMSVYIGIPVNKLPEADVFLKLFFSQLINLNTDQVLGADPSLKYTCLVLLDEFPALGYMPIVDKAAPYIAGYGLRMVTIAQSRGQISKPPEFGGYGREGAKALFDNHALSILYTPKDKDDANEYSEVLGYDTVKSQSRNLRKRWEGSESDSRRALMLPQELMRMSQEQQIIQLEGVRPIRCAKIRYYKERVFIDRLKSVSPSLARLGRKMPTQKQLEAAWGSGELSAPVPTQVIYQSSAVEHSTRAVSVSDIEEGVDLANLAIDIRKLPTVAAETSMSDEEVAGFVDDFWGALEESTDVDTDQVDMSTGEWLGSESTPGTDFVDLKQLRA